MGMPGKESPVKFASLLFFEKFNGASRDQGSEIRDSRVPRWRDLRFTTTIEMLKNHKRLKDSKAAI
jgi:hypothetical protein